MTILIESAVIYFHITVNAVISSQMGTYAYLCASTRLLGSGQKIILWWNLFQAKTKFLAKKVFGQKEIWGLKNLGTQNLFGPQES